MPPADDNVLTALRDHYAEHQVLPSYTTIADFGLGIALDLAAVFGL
jgi:hypothetical protein